MNAKQKMREALNAALNPASKRWNVDAMEFFRLLRAEKVTKDQVVFGIRSPKTAKAEDLKTFEKMASKSDIIQMAGGSDAE